MHLTSTCWCECAESRARKPRGFAGRCGRMCNVRYAVALLLVLPTYAEVVQIGVFSLFHPVELRVSPVSSAVLLTTGDTRVILEGRQSRTISLAHIPAAMRVSAPDGSDTDFCLSIPGKIERQF